MSEKQVVNWKEYRMSFQEKAEQIAKQLTLLEKVSLMSGKRTFAEVREAIQKKSKTHYNEQPYRAGGLREKGIPPLLFADGTRGVVCGRGVATCFPVSLMRGAAFDTELEERVGNCIAKEVLSAGGNLFGGICVNLPYHPGWGRIQESYGEDPCLAGNMGAAMVRGVQERGVIACVKHFAFNSMENARFKVNITSDKRTEREVFLPQFQKCIDAGAGAVMTSYNSYEGTICGHNRYLIRDVLKGEWEFDGFTLTDFNWGMNETAAAANGGQDIEMPNTNYYGQKLVDAVREGIVKEEVIDEAVLRIIRTLLAHQSVISRQGNQGAEIREDESEMKKHRALALKCAREGITLLKNENRRLPLNLDINAKIVVLGYLAGEENTGDKGSSQVYPPYVVTALQGIIQAAQGVEVVYYSGESISHCKRLAKEADAVVIIAGNDYHDEGEYIAADNESETVTFYGGDRRNGLGLKKRDLSVIHAVSEVRSDAIVALYGGMITMADWQECTGAILLLYYPGMEGGTALGEVLFGKVNPGGKLPFAIARDEADLPLVDWNAAEQRYLYHHGYTLLEKNGIRPLYPFGFGLSYTTFDIGNLEVWSEQAHLLASVEICNTGVREGAEVLQMYVRHSQKEGSVRKLKAFQRVFLKTGESRRVILRCDLTDLECFDERKDTFILESGEYEVYIGTSHSLDDLQMKRLSL